jgi:16S rRNA (uracil1498-N3)-methyltransferase
MRIPRIYTQQHLEPNTVIELESQAGHHLTKALRLKLGASVLLFNGQGGEFEASICAIEKRNVQIQLTRFKESDCESPLHIHLGIAVSRGERMDHIMQKATELGVSEITPLFSERSEVRLKGDRLEKKLHHWQNVIISACEQSGRSRLPHIHSAERLTQWVEKTSADQKFVLHHRTDQRIDDATQTKTAALLIGPEGGLSQPEIETAQKQQFNTLSLGPRVLRTETAPLAAITLLQYCWGDM